MGELFVLWLFVMIFSGAVAHSLWAGRFKYHFGPIIKRTERPVEYWAMTGVMAAATLLVTIIAIARTLSR